MMPCSCCVGCFSWRWWYSSMEEEFGDEDMRIDDACHLIIGEKYNGQSWIDLQENVG